MNLPEQAPACPPPNMETLHDAFCRQQRCEDKDFLPRVFWRTIYPHARVVAYIAGHRAECFRVDRALIEYCGRLTSLSRIDLELAEFATIGGHGFLRRRCRIRVSGRRLKKLAAQYLTS